MKLKPQRPYSSKKGEVYYYKCPYCQEHGARRKDQWTFECISCKKDYLYKRDFKKPLALRQ